LKKKEELGERRGRKFVWRKTVNRNQKKRDNQQGSDVFSKGQRHLEKHKKGQKAKIEGSKKEKENNYIDLE